MDQYSDALRALMDAAYQPHPYLFDGVNSAAFAEDEDNGPGFNWELDPLLFDAAQVFKPVVTQEGLFPSDADLCIGVEYRHMVVPPENKTICVGKEW